MFNVSTDNYVLGFESILYEFQRKDIIVDYQKRSSHRLQENYFPKFSNTYGNILSPFIHKYDKIIPMSILNIQKENNPRQIRG